MGVLYWGNSVSNNGTPGFLPEGSALTFGSPTADNQVNFTDNIDLNGEIRRIDVVAGTGGDSALISGVISNVQVYATNVGLQKTGAGTLILSGSNTYNGTTTIASGVLQAVDGVGLPSTSNLVLSGSIAQTGVGAVLQSSGTFDRSMGTAAGQLQWSGDGGFAASGGSLLVTLNNGTTLQWGNTNSYFLANGGVLTFGSPSANNQVDLTNNLDLAGLTRRIDVAAGAGGDSALISGNISDSVGGGGLEKTGAGELILSGTNSYNGGTIVAGAGRGQRGLVAGRNAAAGGRRTGPSSSILRRPRRRPVVERLRTRPISTVPEPGTPALLAAVACSAVVYHGARSQRKRS